MTNVTREQLPPGWELVELGEAFKWGSGGTPRASDNSNFDGDIPWAVIGDLNDHRVDTTSKTLTEKGLRESSAKLVQPGELLVAMYGSIGKLGIPTIPMATNQAIAFTRDTPSDLSISYLFYYLLSIRGVLHYMGKGGTQTNISQTVLKAVPLPLPPSNEQVRIVVKIEELFSELDDSVANLESARARLQTYRQSLLKHAFEGRLTEQWRRDHADELDSADQLLERIREERQARYQQELEDWKAEVGQWEEAGKPGHKPRKPKAPKALPRPSEAELVDLPGLPCGWNWIRLGEAADVAGGLTKNPKRESLEVRRPFLRVANVYANRLELDEVHEIGLEEAELPKVTLAEGDLLVVEGNGSVDQIGRVAVWDGRIPRAVHQNHLIRARPVSVIQSAFALWFLLSKKGRNHIMRVASSTSGLHTLSLSKVENLLIPVCSPNEQILVLNEVEARLSQIDAIKRTIEPSIHQTKLLRQSVLKRAFEGRLVSQNPDDEPASELLARILGEEPEHVEVAAGSTGTQAEP